MVVGQPVSCRVLARSREMHRRTKARIFCAWLRRIESKVSELH